MFWKKFFLVTFKQETNKRRSGRIRDFRFLSKLASFGTEIPLLKALEIGIIWQISGTCADIASLAHHVDSHVFGSRKIEIDFNFFQITVGRANCDVLTSADPSCWSDRSWGASWWTAVGFILSLQQSRHLLSNPRPTPLNQPKSESSQSFAML